jgi:putative FmdB family regulatory protein
MGIIAGRMPIYEYRCKKGHQFEVFQSMADDPVTKCEVCRAKVERVFHPIAVHFKGSGFYTTDYAKKGSANSSGDSESKSESKSDSSSKSEQGSKSDSSSKADSGSKSDAKPAKKSSD